MTFKELYEKQYADKIERDNEMFPFYGCPSDYFDFDADTADKCPDWVPDSPDTRANCAKCWEREIPKEKEEELYPVSIPHNYGPTVADVAIAEMEADKKKTSLKYQERVSTRAEVRALYERMLKDHHVAFYRGYTKTKSYGWNPDADDYVKMDGEFWFENPGYDPNYDSEQIPRLVDKFNEVPLLNIYNADAIKEALKNSPEMDEMSKAVDGLVNVGEKVSKALKDVVEASRLKKALGIVSPSAAITGETEGPRILDSGNRREFETGAVRDICEGKGRCDLLPLDVVGHALANVTFKYIHQYQVEDGDYERLYDALSSSGIFHDFYTMLLEVAKHFEEGCKKYGDNNWQKGIPTHCYIDSAVRHYLKYLRGDKDEPHDRAFCWNILCCIWTCIHKPELNDYAPKEEKDAPMYNKKCPFCGRECQNFIGANLFCECNAKYYWNEQVWLNRKTGEKVKEKRDA